jgi:hypothetical protein
LSTGHLRGEVKTPQELYLVLGEADTSSLYAKSVKLDTSHDIPYAGGVSVDGKTVYIDRTLYRDVMSGKVKVRGMSPRQLIACWSEHEHTEKTIDDGDNPVDDYLAAHGMATAKEHESVELILGKGKADGYEDQITQALKRCMARDPADPPKDLWCGPYLDNPEPRDLELIRIFKAKGVKDAFKHSKADPKIGYGMGGRNCDDCAMYMNPDKESSECEIVCGLVRYNRQCLKWVERR